MYTFFKIRKDSPFCIITILSEGFYAHSYFALLIWIWHEKPLQLTI